MNSYNGFSGAQRMKAQRWLNEMWGRGLLARPSECTACGQTEGVIDAHTEDYSEPFAAGKTDQWPLCYRCHMMLHCRFSAPVAFQRYRKAVAGGIRYEAMTERNFYRLRNQHIHGHRVGWTQHEPRPDALGQLAGAKVGDAAEPGAPSVGAGDQLNLSV